MKLHDYEPSPTSPRRGRAFHRADSSVLTCTACGCRLTARASLADGGRQGPDAAWRHYPGLSAERDARGCRVECVDEAHRLASYEEAAVA